MDPYQEFAEFYDVYVGERLDDLPLYLDVARSSRTPMLEIGAGSGRLTVPLAREDVSVVAVDISPAMLAILRSRLAQEPESVQRRVEMVEADACRLDLRRQFAIVIVPFYTFNYLLTSEAQTRGLERMAAHLTSAGRLLIDVFIPLRLLEQGPPDPILKVDRVNPATGSRVRGWNTYTFDQTRQIEHRRHIFEVSQPDGTVRRREFTTRRRYWFRRELAELFEQHGLRVDGVSTGYTGAPADERSEQLVYELRRR